MIARVAVAAAVLCSALPALAEFEGIADLKLTGRQEGQAMEGTGRVYLSPVGWRMEMEMKLPGFGRAKGDAADAKPFVQHMVTFGRVKEPNKSFILNERAKTYVVVDGHGDAKGDGAEEQGWKITRLGQDRVAGFSCTNVKAEREGSDETYEACLAKDFVSETWLKSAREGKEWWVGAARRAGYTGYPVRLVGRAKDGAERHRMEIVKVEKRKIPASMFEIPAGYKEGSMMDAMSLTPEQQQQVQEAARQAAESMKNMSPEQRKMIEDMMKKQGQRQR